MKKSVLFIHPCLMGLGYAEDRFFSTEVRRGGVIIELIRTGIHRTQMQSDG